MCYDTTEIIHTISQFLTPTFLRTVFSSYLVFFLHGSYIGLHVNSVGHANLVDPVYGDHQHQYLFLLQ
jgi:hypothetical protein